ncbi:MAG: hypothetical protein ABSD28_16050 [Tepidisphaeraceae bacterium]|jgi:enamine deaminase RidA (YjgF/YER057c/UK114 family)
MSQAMQGSNLGQLAQWTGQLRKQVKALLEELDGASKAAGLGSARARDERLAELGRQVQAWRGAVRPLIGAMRAARGQRRVQTSGKRAGVLKDLSRRVRQVRREAREALERFDAALRRASSEARSMRAQQIVSIDSMVESLRGRLRQFMADVRERRARENAAARGQRAGFVQKLKGAGLGVDGGRKAGGGVKRAAVKKPRWAADQPGFVQNILGLKRPRKIA